MMDKFFQRRCYSHSRRTSDIPYNVVVSQTFKETHLEIMTHCNGQGRFSSSWLEFLYLGTFSVCTTEIFLVFHTMNN